MDVDKCGKLLKDIETKTGKDKKGQMKHGKDAAALWLREAKGRSGHGGDSGRKPTFSGKNLFANDPIMTRSKHADVAVLTIEKLYSSNG